MTPRDEIELAAYDIAGDFELAAAVAETAAELWHAIATLIGADPAAFDQPRAEL